MLAVSFYHKFLFQLSKVRFYTPAAQVIAEARQRYMTEYFERLRLEVKGEA